MIENFIQILKKNHFDFTKNVSIFDVGIVIKALNFQIIF
jgi:hypothetical protein